VTPENYCRDIEAYLCRKNDGHLIRIAGPAFEQVTRWAEQGIPLKIACAGIDRYCERYYRKGPRRRPVRIEFCEADVLDAFDDWRRAVGVTDQQAAPARPRLSLAAHIERVIARLTALRASSQAASAFGDVLERVARELDQILPAAKGARGDARETLLTRLAALDRELAEAATSAADERVQQDARAQADEQLAAFRGRMAPDAYERARRVVVERHVREHFQLPAVTFP
jgi:hypothetical protein